MNEEYDVKNEPNRINDINVVYRMPQAFSLKF